MGVAQSRLANGWKMQDGIRNQLEGLDVERKRLETFMSSDPAWLAYCQLANEVPPASIAEAQAVEQNLAPDMAGKLRENRLFRAWRNLLAASDSLRELLDPEEPVAAKPEQQDQAKTETEPAKSGPPPLPQEPQPSAQEAFRTKLVVKSDVPSQTRPAQDDAAAPGASPLPQAPSAPEPKSAPESKPDNKYDTKSNVAEPAIAQAIPNDAPVMQALSALLSNRACATSQLTGQLAAAEVESDTASKQHAAKAVQPVAVAPQAQIDETAIEAEGEPEPTAETAHNVEPDDLSLIRQVGSDDVAVLNGAGLNSFSEIASLTAAQVKDLKKELPEPARISRQQWIEQAAVLAEGRQTDHARYKRNLLGDSLVRPPPFEAWDAAPLPVALPAPQPQLLEAPKPDIQAPEFQVQDEPVTEQSVAEEPAPDEVAPVEPIPVEPPATVAPEPASSAPGPEPEALEDTLVSTEAALPALDELLVNFAPPALAKRAASAEVASPDAQDEPPAPAPTSDVADAAAHASQSEHEDASEEEVASKDDEHSDDDDRAGLIDESMPLSARMERFERTMAEVSLPDLRRPQPFEAEDRAPRNGHATAASAVAPVVPPADMPVDEPELTPPPLPDVVGTEAKLVDIEGEPLETDFDWSSERVEADWSEADVEIVIVAREPSTDDEVEQQEATEVAHLNGEAAAEEPVEEESQVEPSPYDLARRMDRLAHYKSEEDERFVRFNGEVEEASVQIIRAEPEEDIYPEKVAERPKDRPPVHRAQPAPTAVPDRIPRSSEKSSRRFLDALTGSRKAR